MKRLSSKILIWVVIGLVFGYFVVVVLLDRPETDLIQPLDIANNAQESDEIDSLDVSESDKEPRDLLEILYNVNVNDERYKQRTILSNTVVYDYPDLKINKVYWAYGQITAISITNNSDTTVIVNSLKYEVTDRSNNLLYDGYISLGDKDIFSRIAENINNISNEPKDSPNHILPNKSIKINTLDTDNPRLEQNEKISIWLLKQ